MIRFLLLFVPLFSFCQTYVELGGGVAQMKFNNMGIYTSVRQDIGVTGLRLTYFNIDGENLGYDSFQFQGLVQPFKGMFYSPIIVAGMQLSSGDWSPVVGFHNLFRVQDNLHLQLNYDDIDSEPYISIGMSIKFNLIRDKDFKPRFF